MSKRNSYDKNFKAKIVLEELKDERSIAEIVSEHGIHSNQITQWKQQLIEGLPEMFERKKLKGPASEDDRERDELYRQIGKMKIEIDWLKKARSLIPLTKDAIDMDFKEISVRRQCELMEIPWSAVYYKPVPDDEDEYYKLLIFEEYKRCPFYGYRKITEALRRKGHWINRKRMYRLMHEMRLKAISPKPNLGRPAPGQEIYPYLLRGIRIDHPNQVWATDITYIRLQGGFVYLAAIIDLYSRKVLSWALSNTLDVQFCLDALEEALMTYGKSEIFNSDQESQFTSKKFTDILKEHEIRISMDGKGRAQDNIYVEWLWRSLKYEDIYLKEYNTIPECRAGIKRYFEFFNQERFHQSLDYLIPDELYYISWDKAWELKQAC